MSQQDRGRAEHLLRAVIDNVVDGIISIDPAGRIESFNRPAERIFGYSASEVLGRDISVLMPEPDDPRHGDFAKSDPPMGAARIIGTGRKVTGKRKDGSLFPMDLAVTEYELDGARHFAGVVRDITQAKKLEEQLLHSRKMEAIGQLAGGIAHDFNNLLTIISGYSSLLLASLAADDSTRPAIGEIRLAAERASALTRQLLIFSRKQVFAPRILDLNEIVSGTDRMLRRLIGENITIATAPDPQISRVRSDAAQIEQVIVTLAINARDAMPDGGLLTIETREVELGPGADPDCPPGRYVMLAMTDTGCGMTPETRARLFEPFFTTKKETPDKRMGLGLAAVYGIVKQSGGGISVYTEPGIGSCFKVYLPAIGPAASRPGATESQPIKHGCATILLVEDEEGVRRLARIILESHGYRVIEACNGADGLEAAQAHGGLIDLVLTDVVMPRMSGSQLVEHLRQQRSNIKVLFMSGYADDAVVRHGVVSAGFAYLQKPFAPHALVQKVREILE